MVTYLYQAMSIDKYADWAELDVVTAVKPDQSKYRETGAVYFPASAEYFITDGQHRYCALMDFARRYPELAKKFTQAVAISVLPQDRLDEWAGQSFHDKNYLRTQVKMTQALAVDNRDLHNVLTKELHSHQAIKDGGGVNEVKDALAATAKGFATHAVLYRFTRAFCEGRRGLEKGAVRNPRPTEDTFETFKAELFEYIEELSTVLPNWTSVPGREHYLFRSSPALQALGTMGHDLYTKVAEPTMRSEMVQRIRDVHLDWKRSNVAEWESVIGIAVEDEKGLRQLRRGQVARPSTEPFGFCVISRDWRLTWQRRRPRNRLRNSQGSDGKARGRPTPAALGLCSSMPRWTARLCKPAKED